MEYYLAIEKNEILSFVIAWIDMEDIMLSEINQIQNTIIVLFHLYDKCKKQSKWTKKWNRHIDTNRLVFAEGSRLGELVQKGEGIKKWNLVVTNSHRDIKKSMGNITNIIVITMYDTVWELEILKVILHKLYNFITTKLCTWNQYK